MVKKVIGCVFLVWMSVPAAWGQLESGDLVVGCLPPGNGLYRVSRTGSVETLLGPSFNFPNAVTLGPDNTTMAVALADSASSYVRNQLLTVTPDGICSTLALIQPGPPNALDLSEDGALLVFAASQNAVLRVPMAGGSFSTVQKLPAGSMNAGALDLADGGLMLGAYWQRPQGGLIKAGISGHLNTLAWDLGRISCIAADVIQGDWVVTRFDAPEVLRVDATGRVTTLVGFQGANAVAIDADQSLWLASGTILLHTTKNGVPIASHILPGYAADLEIYGRRTLVGSGPAKSGSTHSLSIQSHKSGDGNQPYVLAASTRLRPALALGDGRRLAIGSSPLLTLSLLGPIPGLKDFKGTLDPFGRATASIAVPEGLAGLRIFVTGVVLDPLLGRVSTVLNTVGVTFK